VAGALPMGVLLNGLMLMNVSSYIQQIVIGMIIMLAVAFDRESQLGRQADRASS
jgi:inositol transport system permease protein